ncbi:MAG: nucleotidyltransferase family protein, partial [Thermodesulfovibrionales bacterium]
MNLSHENSLLLCCAQTKLSDNSSVLLNELLCHPLDWECISESAFSQNIAQLLYHNLKGITSKHLIPPGVMEKLKRAYCVNIARNMHLYAEFRNITNAFHSAGIEVIALKGVVLAGIVYRDIGLRPMRDIDLLVRKDDLEVAHRIMTDLMYTPQVKVESEQWNKQKHFHLPAYRNSDKTVVVEIHWHFAENSLGIDMQKWWDRARSENIMGCCIKVPSPEDMLIHLCIHLYNHGYTNKFVLRGLCDIAETLRHYEIEMDWKLLQDEIKNHGIAAQVHSMLYLAGKYFDQGSGLHGLIDLNGVDHHFLGILEESLFADQGLEPINPYLLKSMFYDNFLKKAQYLFPKVFPSRKEMSKRYPVSPSSKRLFYYYLVHPFH